MTPLQAHAAYAAVWILFGIVHSGLAAERAKAALEPIFGRAYRLAYNILAAAQTAATLAFGLSVLPGSGLFDLPIWVFVLQAGLVLGGCYLMAAGAHQYRMSLFLGLDQLRGRSALDDEPLSTGGLNAYIRHPWYSAGLMILWGSAVSPFGLATAAWGSLYVLVGAAIEDSRLLRRYGAGYAEYRRRVPAFVPWRRAPGRTAE